MALALLSSGNDVCVLLPLISSLVTHLWRRECQWSDAVCILRLHINGDAVSSLISGTLTSVLLNQHAKSTTTRRPLYCEKGTERACVGHLVVSQLKPLPTASIICQTCKWRYFQMIPAPSLAHSKLLFHHKPLTSTLLHIYDISVYITVLNLFSVYTLILLVMLFWLTLMKTVGDKTSTASSWRDSEGEALEGENILPNFAPSDLPFDFMQQEARK